MSEKSPTDYEIGYGKPPKHHQYKPGHSGNRNGRPKRKSDHNTSAIALYRSLGNSLSRRVVVYENGRKKRITLRDYIIEKYIQSTLKDPRTFANFFKLVERADRAALDGLAGETMTIEIIGGLPD